jgi:hypothetical protein
MTGTISGAERDALVLAHFGNSDQEHAAFMRGDRVAPEVSRQMLNLLGRYGAANERQLLRAIAKEYTEETGERHTLRDAEALLDGMLEAEYQRIEGGAYDKPEPEPEPEGGMSYEQYQRATGEPTTPDGVALEAEYDALEATPESERREREFERSSNDLLLTAEQRFDRRLTDSDW